MASKHKALLKEMQALTMLDTQGHEKAFTGEAVTPEDRTNLLAGAGNLGVHSGYSAATAVPA